MLGALDRIAQGLGELQGRIGFLELIELAARRHQVAVQDGVPPLGENGSGDLHLAALLAHDADGAREEIAPRVMRVELDQGLERETGERLLVLLQVLDQQPLGFRDLRRVLSLLGGRLGGNRTHRERRAARRSAARESG